MIKFKREGNDAVCVISLDMPFWNTRDFHFTWSTGSEVCSSLLTKHAEEALKTALRKVRETAYNQGWKDAKSKKRKEDWFISWI